MARFSIGDLEELLFAAFPREDAQPGDRIGLMVGNRLELAGRVALALDATVPMIEAAAGAGANVLVTHHPPFWNAPLSFVAAPSAASADGAAVYAAARAGISILTMHTNVDCSPRTQGMLLTPVGLEYTAPLRADRLGQLAKPAAPREYLTFGELVDSYKVSFGKVAKAWGDPSRPLFTFAACSGGAGEVVEDVIKAQVDCFITGELAHHAAAYLADEGIALIELGHDLSELPYRGFLAQVLIEAGYPSADLVTLEPQATWW